MHSTLIAFSFDMGKNWCFVDVSSYEPDRIRELIPNLSARLHWPAQGKPEFFPD
jgi:hypothetical protein